MRKTARLLLKRRWLSASLTTLVALMAVAVLPLPYLFFSDKIALIISIFLSLFAINPILMGQKRWCAKLEFDKKPHIAELFYFFTTPKRYLKSVFTEILIFLRVTLIAVASMLPTATCVVLADWLKTQQQNEVVEIFINNCLFLAIIGAVIFSVLFIISAVKTTATSYIVAVDDKISIVKAMKMSSKLIRQNGGYLIKTLALSLLPSLFIVPIFVIVPFFVTVFTQCVKSYSKQ